MPSGVAASFHPFSTHSQHQFWLIVSHSAWLRNDRKSAATLSRSVSTALRVGRFLHHLEHRGSLAAIRLKSYRDRTQPRGNVCQALQRLTTVATPRYRPACHSFVQRASSEHQPHRAAVYEQCTRRSILVTRRKSPVFERRTWSECRRAGPVYGRLGQASRASDDSVQRRAQPGVVASCVLRAISLTSSAPR